MPTNFRVKHELEGVPDFLGYEYKFCKEKKQNHILINILADRCRTISKPRFAYISSLFHLYKHPLESFT